MVTIPVMIICLVTSLHHSASAVSQTDNISSATTAPSEQDSDVTQDIKANVSNVSAVPSNHDSGGMDTETNNISSVIIAPSDLYSDIIKGNETNISSITKAPSDLDADTFIKKTENSNNGNTLESPLEHTAKLHSYHVSTFQPKPFTEMTSKKEDLQKSEDTSFRPSTIWSSFISSKLYTASETMENKEVWNQQSEINAATLLATIPSEARSPRDDKITSRLFIRSSNEMKTNDDTTAEPELSPSKSTLNRITPSLTVNLSQNTTSPFVKQPSTAVSPFMKQSFTAQSPFMKEPSTDVPPFMMQSSTDISPFMTQSFTDISLTTSSWSLSGFSSRDGLCPPETITLTNATEGIVTWAFNYSSCVQEYNWLFDIPQGYDCFVEFHHIDMQFTDTLHVINLFDSIEYTMRNFTQFNNESLAPSPVYGGTLKIKASLPLNKFKSTRTSNFNVSFTVLLPNTLPTFSIHLDAKPRESYLTYLCTGISPLPAAITCDGVRHCEHGEDEEGCAYRETGCGNWFPYNDHCLKATFTSNQDFSCGHAIGTMPLKAEQICQSEYNATLAVLSDTTGMQLAANMIQKSGFLNAVVGIKKVKPVSRKTKHLYRFLWQWGDRGSSIAYEQQLLQRSGAMENCGVLTISPNPSLQSVQCDRPPSLQGYICMRPNPRRSVQVKKPHSASFHTASALPDQFPTKECPDGSVVQTFHRCQWGEHEADSSNGWSPSNLPLFQCRFGPAIHYSLLCDGKDDCVDSSDERSCQKPRYSPLLSSSFFCENLQAIATNKRCDGIPDCFDGTDEEYCISCYGIYFCSGLGCMPSHYAHIFDTCPLTYREITFSPTPYNTGSVRLDGYGMSVLEPVAHIKCPEGFYQCLNGLCIPGFLMNNGEKDCFHGEDEDIPAHSMTCPGYYRCQRVGSCVHKNFVCDGIYHCPDKDDEMFCHMTCPHDQGCVCEGQAFTCSNMIDPLQHLHVRYLDFSSATNVSLENIHVMEYLFFLNLSLCHLHNVTLRDMPVLQTLDLSFNSLTELASLHLHKLPGLLFLDLSNNPLGRTLNSVFSILLKAGELENLRTLILVNISLEEIADRVFSPLTKLQHLDLRNNPLHTYDQESLWGLQALEVLYADQSKLCCYYFHPSLHQCYAPVDELSSCDDLLAQNFFRVFLWTVSFLAVAGNLGVLIYRLFIHNHESNLSSPILLKNLCASDFLMGVYMMMIGVADAQFQGNYVAKEAEWTKSVTCTIAGFLSFVSSEVSAFLICMITLDRVLVICFPFSYQYHLGSRVTIIVCCMVWVIGLTLAAVPLLAGMEFYGLNGICLPLPITRQQYSGQTYAFSIFIVLNFVIFVFIGIGQALIYRAINSARTASRSQRQHKDMTIARRLFIIVFTNFCCWFPVGVMGLLAVHGTPIPGQLNVWTAIFVLPLNSALNPFLYTLNGLLEKWKKRRMEERAQRLLGKLQTEIPKWQPSSVQQLMKVCVQSKKVEKEVTMRWLGVNMHTTSTQYVAEEIS